MTVSGETALRPSGERRSLEPRLVSTHTIPRFGPTEVLKHLHASPRSAATRTVLGDTTDKFVITGGAIERILPTPRAANKQNRKMPQRRCDQSQQSRQASGLIHVAGREPAGDYNTHYSHSAYAKDVTCRPQKDDHSPLHMRLRHVSMHSRGSEPDAWRPRRAHAASAPPFARHTDGWPAYRRCAAWRRTPACLRVLPTPR